MVHDAADDPAGSVALQSGSALATSSTIRRRWRCGADMVHHILDPRTGWSADPVWRTVSVAAQTCLAANTVSTAAIVRGWRALDWIRALDIPARLVDSDRSVHTICGWPTDDDGVKAVIDQALWALGRGTGITALAFMTVSLFLGIATRSGRPLVVLPRFAVADVHRFAALAGTLLVVLHMVLLFFDPYAQLRLIDFIVPFLGAYRPLWLGLGTLAFDVLAVVIVTSLLRHRLGGAGLPRGALGDLRLVADSAMAHATRERDRRRPRMVSAVRRRAARLTVCGALVWRLHAKYTEYAGTRTSGRP